MAEDRT